MTIQSRRQPQSEKSSFPGKQISVSGVSLVWKIMELSDVEIDGTKTNKQTYKITNFLTSKGRGLGLALCKARCIGHADLMSRDRYLV